MAGKRVLLFSVSYAPESTGIGPYSAAMAEALADDGALVTAVAGLPHYPEWRYSASDRRLLLRRERRGQVDVMRLRQLVFRRQNALLRALYELSFLAHGVLRSRQFPNPHVVVAVSPGLAGAVLGRLVARRHGVPFVVVAQDLVGAAASQSGITGGGTVAAAAGRIEGWLMRTADVVGVVHQSFVPTCLRMGVDERRIRVVANWSLQMSGRPEVTVESAPERPPSWEGKFVVLHAGNIGFKQGLEVVVETGRLARQQGHTDVLFVLMGDGNRRDVLAPMVAELEAVEIRDPVSAAVLPDMLRAADLLLVTQRARVLDMSVASKLTAYFTAARPVVCAAATSTGTAAEVRRSKGGVVVHPDSPQELLEAVLRLRSDPVERERLGRLGFDYASHHLTAAAGRRRLVELVSHAMTDR